MKESGLFATTNPEYLQAQTIQLGMFTVSTMLRLGTAFLLLTRSPLLILTVLEVDANINRFE